MRVASEFDAQPAGHDFLNERELHKVVGQATEEVVAAARLKPMQSAMDQPQAAEHVAGHVSRSRNAAIGREKSSAAGRVARGDQHMWGKIVLAVADTP